MENIKPPNKRGDIGILQVHILWVWWCDFGYPDYRQSMVVLACDVGMQIEGMWWPNRWCYATGQRSSGHSAGDGCGVGEWRMSSACGVVSAWLWWVSVLAR